MKIKYLLSMAVFGLMAAACTNDVNEVLAPEAAPQKGIPFIAIISPKSFDATTRALTEIESEAGNFLKSEWAENETFLLVYKVGGVDQMTLASVDKVDSDGTATIKANLKEGVTDGTSVTLNYPGDSFNADILAEQDGKLNDKMDVRRGTGTISVKDGKATLEAGAKLDPLYAIVKFTLKDLWNLALALDHLIISDDEGMDVTTIKLKSGEDASSTLYAALPEYEDKVLWFESSDDGGGAYIAKGTANLEKGKFYTPTLKMATEGNLMNSDGTFSTTLEEGKTPIGIIAYLGRDYTEDVTVGGGHGLVMALKNAYGNEYWSNKLNERAYEGNDYVTKLEDLTRTTGWSGYNATISMAAVMDGENPVHISAYYARNYSATAPEGTTGWFLPSAQQWVKMITGLGGLEESNLTWNSWFDPTYSASKKWEEALKKAGEGNYDSIRDVELWYWTSSETSADSAVTVVVNNDSSYGLNVYGCPKYDYNRTRVRAMLAF